MKCKYFENVAAALFKVVGWVEESGQVTVLNSSSHLETAKLVAATRVKACFSNSQPAVTHPWVELKELIKS